MLEQIFKGMTYYKVELDSKEETEMFVSVLKKNLCPVFEVKNNIVECMIIDSRELEIEKEMDKFNGLI
ncbi:MAG: hypothetical protein IJA72_03510 [Clostridia bacterium]|nr:hypothetical protein [Clostridia bacterium]